MKKTAKATPKPHAKRTPNTVPSNWIGGFNPLVKVEGFYDFQANIQLADDGARTWVEIPFTLPAGVPVWEAVATLTQVGYVFTDVGRLVAFHVGTEVHGKDKSTAVLKIYGSMQIKPNIDPRASASAGTMQIDVAGVLMFYSAPTPPTPALKRSNVSEIKILANRPRR